MLPQISNKTLIKMFQSWCHRCQLLLCFRKCCTGLSGCPDLAVKSRQLQRTCKFKTHFLITARGFSL